MSYRTQTNMCYSISSYSPLIKNIFLFVFQNKKNPPIFLVFFFAIFYFFYDFLGNFYPLFSVFFPSIFAKFFDFFGNKNPTFFVFDSAANSNGKKRRKIDEKNRGKMPANFPNKSGKYNFKKQKEFFNTNFFQGIE